MEEENLVKIGKHLYNAEEIIEKIFVPRGIKAMETEEEIEEE